MTPSIKIIAEAGVNHNGDINIALNLAQAARDVGADIIKYQSFVPKELTLPSAKTAQYQNVNTQENYQIELLKKLQLSDREQAEIKCYCDKIGIEFLSTGFDINSLKKLIRLGIKRIKIPSGEITNIPLLEFIGAQKLPIILSTGMSTLSEITHAYEILVRNGASKKSISVLHCTSSYPATDDELNLRALISISNALNTEVGYSDHSIGKEASIAAVALGATIIEKHITIDRSMDGPDHNASMEIEEFKDFIQSIRRVSVALGMEKKEPSAKEKATLNLVRKSIVSAKKIKAGEVFNSYNLTTKRPGTGLSAIKWNQLLGNVSKRDYEKNELIDGEEI